jgi:phytanoyl-CoA hydroxylase
MLENAESLPELHELNRSFTWTPVRPPFSLISEEQARSYNQHGFFVFDNAFDCDTIARAIAEIDPWEAKVEDYLRTQPGGRRFIAEAGGISFTTDLVKRSQFIRDLSASPVIAGVCRDLLGPDVRLYRDQAVYKKPEYPKLFPWHQDNGYNFVEPQTYLTCWIALTDATVDNGCPWVMPGGHLRGTLKHHLTELGWVCREEDGPEAAAVPVRAGGMVVFSSLMPHRTGPNLTGDVRKACILQYAPNGARWLQPPALCNADRQYLIVKDGERVAPPPLHPR